MIQRNTLKKFNLPLATVLLVLILSSCSSSIRQIGKVNMISQRNIDTRSDYKLIKSYVGLSNKEIKRSRNSTIEESIDDTVRSVPGGEYLMNAKIYIIDGKYFATEGDVWGRNVEEFKGFKIGDMVQWNTFNGMKKGTITGLIDDQECMVEAEGENNSIRKKYDRLVKVMK